MCGIRLGMERTSPVLDWLRCFSEVESGPKWGAGWRETGAGTTLPRHWHSHRFMSDADQKLCRICGRSSVVKATQPAAVRGVCVILNCCPGKIMFTLRAVQQRSAVCFEGLTYNAFKFVICLYSVADYKSRSALNAGRGKMHSMLLAQIDTWIYGPLARRDAKCQGSFVKLWLIERNNPGAGGGGARWQRIKEGNCRCGQLSLHLPFVKLGSRPNPRLRCPGFIDLTYHWRIGQVSVAVHVVVGAIWRRRRRRGRNIDALAD